MRMYESRDSVKYIDVTTLRVRRVLNKTGNVVKRSSVARPYITNEASLKMFCHLRYVLSLCPLGFSPLNITYQAICIVIATIKV